MSGVPIPAFPTVDANRAEDYGTIGMTLRDYFAAKAMQGILAGDHPITHELDALQSVTQTAYEFADAMLKARQS